MPYYAEMSEWFKEHDWKSCVRLKRTGGSNPLLCAKKRDMPSGVSLFLMLSNFLFFDKKLCSALGNIDLHLPKFVAAIQ